MYYPFLRGRQFELIALRELSDNSDVNKYVVPIIEPVKASFNNLKLAFEKFANVRQNAFLILNPKVGELNKDATEIINFYKDFNALNDIIKPAFYFSSNSNALTGIINDNSLTNCMLIFPNDIVKNAELENFTKLHSIQTIVMEEPGRNRDLDRYFKNQRERSGKKYIRLDDLFIKESKNSDYLEKQESKFSEEHKYFHKENFDGFADYTPLDSDFTEGGSLPRAVVIHLTYLNEDEQIIIRHFTSESNFSVSDVQGKFAEALEKAVNFIDEKKLQNPALEELKSYYEREHYPGLGTIKKTTIMNHIYVVSEYLRSHSNEIYK